MEMPGDQRPYMQQQPVTTTAGLTTFEAAVVIPGMQSMVFGAIAFGGSLLGKLPLDQGAGLALLAGGSWWALCALPWRKAVYQFVAPTMPTLVQPEQREEEFADVRISITVNLEEGVKGHFRRFELKAEPDVIWAFAAICSVRESLAEGIYCPRFMTFADYRELRAQLVERGLIIQAAGAGGKFTLQAGGRRVLKYLATHQELFELVSPTQARAVGKFLKDAAGSPTAPPKPTKTQKAE